MHPFERIYDISIIIGTAVMIAICLNIPKKTKYNKRGEIERASWMDLAEWFSINFTVLFFILSLTIILCHFFGTAPDSRGERYYPIIQDYWYPLFFILAGLCAYAANQFFQLNKTESTRKSILYVRTKHLPELEVKQLHKFCKKYNLKVFPITHFESLVSQNENTPKIEVLKMMETELAQYEHYLEQRQKMETYDADLRMVNQSRDRF